MMAGTLLSIPIYIPDPTSAEQVVGYELQSCAPTVGMPVFTGTWTAVTGSPFSSPNNIVDPNGTSATQYQARPIRQVTLPDNTVVTLDTPWSPPFLPNTLVYDAWFTRVLLPALRFVYMNDNGIAQSNGTTRAENIGPGLGLWTPDGTKKRFPLQFVANDDPIRVLDSVYQMTHQNSEGAYIQCLPEQDYHVHLKSGIVEFADAPAPTDYLRFDFFRSDFVNADLLSGLKSAVNALSQFGINGFEAHRENNLIYVPQLLDTDVQEIVCKLAIYLMRQGATESALRSSMSWRDGGVSEDPYPSRALEFLVQDLQITEKSLQLRANAYIRSHTRPKSRGSFDLQFDLTQITPFNINIFAPYSGAVVANPLWWSWWL